jgi:hypothetical protein
MVMGKHLSRHAYPHTRVGADQHARFKAALARQASDMRGNNGRRHRRRHKQGK